MQRILYDAFLSYATEDQDFAERIAKALEVCGFALWFAPLSLKCGDRLLDSINFGLSQSQSGLLLLSRNFITKNWTHYELDVLLRQHIERDKRLLPIWHGITKEELEKWNPGITGIVGLRSDPPFRDLINAISEKLASGSRLRGVAPVWESPYHRFIQGRGELHANTANGAVFHLWEAVEFPDARFPIFIGGKLYSREELLYHAANAIAHRSGEVREMIGTDDLRRIRKLCKDAGLDPKTLA